MDVSSVLVPSDGSDAADRASMHAIGLAKQYGASVHAISVVDQRVGEGLPSDEHGELGRDLERRGANVTTAIVNRAHERGVVADGATLEGTVDERILEYAIDVVADLIVMGRRGTTPSTDAVLGSTTDRVVRSASVPVLVVPRTAPAIESVDDAYGTVLVTTDGSDAAERAAERGFDLARDFGSKVAIVYVIDETVFGIEDAPKSIIGLLRDAGARATDELADRAREMGVDATTAVLRGVPYRTLLAYAEEADVDAIAMGTRGATGSADVLLGSTTVRVLERTDRPTLVVP